MINDKEIIRSRFKPNLIGIIINSGGLKKLLWTRYNRMSILLSILFFIAYLLTVEIGNESTQVVTNISTTAISLLGGIVGLSLAGLTMIIAFSNPEIVDDMAQKQFKEYMKRGELNASYFQIAIAKFSFIVFVQVTSLLFFVIVSIVEGLNIKVEDQLAYWINSAVFLIEIYLILYSIILVIASILNLFTFSQSSNFMKFLKHLKSDEKQ